LLACIFTSGPIPNGNQIRLAPKLHTLHFVSTCGLVNRDLRLTSYRRWQRRGCHDQQYKPIHGCGKNFTNKPRDFETVPISQNQDWAVPDNYNKKIKITPWQSISASDH
jgi:hypothetical protein